MPEIRILPEQVVNQIAAGEVIERPASVLKELVENALDAGAQNIRILLKGYGRDLIQVVDDGCGMSREDLHLAFERHATSKLSRLEDLQAIRSLGFRGEALPSIASVSFVEVRSRAEKNTSGTLLRLEAGVIVHEEPVAAQRGTSVAVHSLFFNTPARAKFLKSPTTELAHLVRVFKQYALAFPEVAWSFSHEQELDFNLPAGTFADRLNDLFGANFTDKTLTLDFARDQIHVSGVVGKPELVKKSRGDQFILLNRRAVQSTLIHSAVKAALKEQLEEGAWPFYVLYLTMDPALVDVNVHPAKLEVRFADERSVHAAVFHAVRAAVSQFAEVLPPQRTAFHSSSAPEETALSRVEQGHAEVIGLFHSADAPREEQPAHGRPSLLRPAILQVHGRYLVSQISSGLAILDQHAAHERILYERALRSFEERMFHSQQLLFPLLLELNPEEDAVFSEIRDDLAKLGFQIRAFGPRTYSIEAVPAGLRRASESNMVREMIEEYVEFRRADFAPRDALAASFACRAAIRSGDPLSPEEMTALIDELFATKSPLFCPHGRPTVIHLKLSELDRRFKRTE